MDVKEQCQRIREIEKFGYLIVGQAEEETEIREAQTILRMAIGLRRKLDNWSNNNGNKHTFRDRS